MTDTPAHVERLQREMLMARSGEERFIMGALMFDAAREMILASFPPGLTETERKRKLWERLYGGDNDTSKPPQEWSEASAKAS